MNKLNYITIIIKFIEMTNNNVNTRLKQLYLSKWVKFSNELNNIVNSPEYDIKPANPLVLSHRNPTLFEKSDIKVMILGQENNGWEGIFNGVLGSSLDTYSSFYGGEYYTYKGVFNNHFNLLVDLLKERFKNKSIGIFWSNVIKVGKANDKNKPPEYILNITLNEFNVLQEEIDIIKPDIILFLSGPYYDKYINAQINDVEIKNYKDYNLNKVVKLEIPNVKYAFRTYHPNYMNFLGKKKYCKIYYDLISELKDF